MGFFSSCCGGSEAGAAGVTAADMTRRMLRQTGPDQGSRVLLRGRASEDAAWFEKRAAGLAGGVVVGERVSAEKQRSDGSTAVEREARLESYPEYGETM